MNHIRIAILALIGTGNVFGEGPGRGEDGPPGREGPGGARSFGRFFETADSNGDGAVSAAEFSALERIAKIPDEKRNEIFRRFDKNGDGLIQRGEMKPPQRPEGEGRPFPKLHELDTNKDRKVSYDEFKLWSFAKRIPKDRLKNFFERLDTNGDGNLSPEDMTKGRGGHPDRPHDRRPMHQDPRNLIETLDTDGDKALSFSEFRKAPWLKGASEDQQEDQFEEFDSNDDLVIDRSDLPPAGKMGPRGSAGKGPRKDDLKGGPETEKNESSP